MKVRVISKQADDCVHESIHNDLSFEVLRKSFYLTGAPIGVNVVCPAVPSSIVFAHSHVSLVFDTMVDACNFSEALQAASQLAEELCRKALD